MIKMSEVESDAANNKALSWHELKRIFRKTGFYMANLSMVYFLEYTITTCYAAVITERMQ